MSEVDMESSFEMINLLKYRPVAVYESDTENSKCRTGRDAYNEYGKVVLPMIIALGGHLAYRGTCNQHFVGDESQDYDELIVVRYPSRKAYLNMFNSHEYQSAIMHRKAGLEFRVLHASTPV
ncbi:MAG: DUF1330 domain-containing protein [Oceanicoccus sp.]